MESSNPTQPNWTPFQPGDKVICLKSGFSPSLRDTFTEFPFPGRLYAVRRCSSTYLHLCGIMGEYDSQTNDEYAFDPRNFILLEDYRRQRRKINQLANQRQEMLNWKKEVDSLDKNGDPKPRRGKKPGSSNS